MACYRAGQVLEIIRTELTISFGPEDDIELVEELALLPLVLVELEPLSSVPVTSIS